MPVLEIGFWFPSEQAISNSRSEAVTSSARADPAPSATTIPPTSMRGAVPGLPTKVIFEIGCRARTGAARGYGHPSRLRECARSQRSQRADELVDVQNPRMGGQEPTKHLRPATPGAHQEHCAGIRYFRVSVGFWTVSRRCVLALR